MERIEAELLLPGDGEPVTEGVVVIDGSVISYAGPARPAPRDARWHGPPDRDRDAGDVGLPRTLPRYAHPGLGTTPAGTSAATGRAMPA
jgi:hypothetical protein